MNVLFLALGGGRRKGTLAEADQVIAEGGRALILVDSFGPWKLESVPEGVEMVGLTSLERQHWPMQVTDALILRAPDRLLRAIGRGPVRRLAKRIRGAYKRRVGQPIHRRVTVGYHKLWPDRHHGLVMSLVRRREIDFIVVTTHQSMIRAARMQRDLDAAAISRPKTRFSIDHLVDASPTVG